MALSPANKQAKLKRIVPIFRTITLWLFDKLDLEATK
ncbi:hypothetical protein DFP78_102119 [Photobacterium lutimaris]|nr:hypothetical protein DFP78_102119 [Photobacterium lutimaris]